MASYLISPRDIPELIRSLKQTAKEFNEKNKFDKSTDIQSDLLVASCS